jgi:hypothetical protein
MTPFDTYKQYLAFKHHFTKPKYDYFRYGGKSRASLDAFYKRKDRYFFEKTSRKYNDDEVKSFFLANFVETDNPDGLWIGTIIRSGEGSYKRWQTRQQSMYYQYTQQVSKLLDEYTLTDLFKCKGHPPVLKSYLAGETSIETMAILDKILGYAKDFDKKLLDPVWERVSLKIKKYEPFLNIDVFKYKKYLREQVNE